MLAILKRHEIEKGTMNDPAMLTELLIRQGKEIDQLKENGQSKIV